MRKSSIHTDERFAGAIVLVVGLALLIASFSRGLLAGPSSGLGMAGIIVSGIGLIRILSAVFKTRQLPKKEVMRLAEKRKGILTLSEITTALDIEPDLAKKTLEALSKDGIASQRWTEVRKNIWEFPDYMTLPITESIELAKSKGGRLTLDDLVASGHTRETARLTLDTLSEKGLAAQDPNPDAGCQSLIVTTQ